MPDVKKNKKVGPVLQKVINRLEFNNINAIIKGLQSTKGIYRPIRAEEEDKC